MVLGSTVALLLELREMLNGATTRLQGNLFVLQ